MKSPKLTIVALLSVLSFNAVFCAEDVCNEGGLRAILTSAVQNHPTAAKALASVVGAGVLGGAAYAGYKRYNKGAEQEAKAEKKEGRFSKAGSFVKEHKGKFALGTLGAAAVAAPLYAKFAQGVDFKLQPEVAWNAVKSLGSSIAHYAQHAWNNVPEQTPKVIAAEAAGATALVGLGVAEYCDYGVRAIGRKLRNGWNKLAAACRTCKAPAKKTPAEAPVVAPVKPKVTTPVVQSVEGRSDAELNARSINTRILQSKRFRDSVRKNEILPGQTVGTLTLLEQYAAMNIADAIQAQELLSKMS